MLNDETKKKNINKKNKKKLESTKLAHQTCNINHVTEITIKKETIMNYKV
jgi:hypothetical protein